jgi:cell division initiation protein
MMENMEVASAREIEASLRERLDTESITVVREAAQEEAPSAEEMMVTAEAMAAAGMEPVPQETESAVDEQPTAVIRAEGSEPETEDPEVAEPEVEPSTAQNETDKPESLQEPPVTEAASEVEREEPSLAGQSSSQQFFEEGEQSDSRIFRASRFLRRRE